MLLCVYILLTKQFFILFFITKPLFVEEKIINKLNYQQRYYIFLLYSWLSFKKYNIHIYILLVVLSAIINILFIMYIIKKKLQLK